MAYEDVKDTEIARLGESNIELLMAAAEALQERDELTIGELISECTERLGACDSWQVLAAVDVMHACNLLSFGLATGPFTQHRTVYYTGMPLNRDALAETPGRMLTE
jgi:hypothetical protein